MKLVEELRKWLDKPGNSRVKIASLLKYKNTATIAQWLAKGKIPEREIERVEEIIRKVEESK